MNVREFINASSLEASSKTLLVALSVDGDMLLVSSLYNVRTGEVITEMTWSLFTYLELLDCGFDELHAALLTRLLRGEVGVQASAVPLARHGLGVPGNLGAEVLSDTSEQEASQPEMVSHLDAVAGADLELWSRELACRVTDSLTRRNASRCCVNKTHPTEQA